MGDPKQGVPLAGTRFADRRRGRAIFAVVLAPGALGLVGVSPALASARTLPLFLGGAALVWTLLASALYEAIAASGKTAWVLGRRASRDVERYDRFDRAADRWPLLVLAALVLSIAAAPAAMLLDAQAFSMALVAFQGAVVLSTIVPVLLRRLQVKAALDLVERLPRTKLVRPEMGDGGASLEVRVTRDAPTIALPFVEGCHAAVQIRLDREGVVLSRTWPEALPVEDATGQGTLELASVELAGGTNRSGVLVLNDEGSRAECASLEAALGVPLGDTREAQVMSYGVWTIAPGEALFAVGDAESLRQGLGVYRSAADAEGTPIRGESRAALAYVGTGAGLERDLAFELRAGVVLVAASALFAASFLAVGWFVR